jgi:two-component system, sporulation sensor kinase A
MTTSPSQKAPGQIPIPGPSTGELEQIRYALDQSAIVAITDVPGRIKYVNDKFCEISKYGRDELMGQDHRMLNSGYHSQEFMQELWHTIAHGRIWRGEIRNRAKDGSIYWVDTTIVPFLDASGKPWQYMAIRYDITQRKDQEERLRERSALMALGEMAAVVAHEVRNPLAGIRGGVQIIGSMLPERSEGSEFVGDIVARIDSLNAVIEDLLKFARLRDLKLARLDLAELVGDVVRAVQCDPSMRTVDWRISVAEGAVIDGDMDQLRLVLMNLLVNASQAVTGDGLISVSVDLEDGNGVVTVTDSGPGIPAEVRERVFEPFFTTKLRGTGLGLPTAKRIVDAHGGRIDLIDAPGGGTVARVKLPIRRSA